MARHDQRLDETCHEIRETHRSTLGRPQAGIESGRRDEMSDIEARGRAESALPMHAGNAERPALQHIIPAARAVRCGKAPTTDAGLSRPNPSTVNRPSRFAGTFRRSPTLLSEPPVY
jgi:hypothetical protein